jgi:hypothetical protein
MGCMCIRAVRRRHLLPSINPAVCLMPMSFSGADIFGALAYHYAPHNLYISGAKWQRHACTAPVLALRCLLQIKPGSILLE